MKKTVMTKSALTTRRLTVCGILAAVGVVCMLIGAVTEVLDLTMLVLASLCVVFTVIEIGIKWAWLVWAVTSLLCFLLLPSKAVALLYFLGGMYPIAKAGFEKRQPIVSWILKFALFNVLLCFFLLTAQKVLGLSGMGYEFAVLEFAVGNGAFLLYDLCLTSCITLYLVRLRRRLKVKSLRD